MTLISKKTWENLSKTPGVRNRVDEILTPMMFGQSILGAQILEPTWSWRKYIFHAITTLSVLVYVAFGTVEFISNTSDINLIAEGLVTVLIVVYFPTKCLIFIANRVTFKYIYSEVKTTLYKFIRDEAPEKVEEVEKRLKYLCILLYIIVITPVNNYLIIALWNYAQGTRVTLSKTTSILMPMKTPYHELGLFIHLVFLYGVSYNLLVIGIWFTVLIYMFSEASKCSVKLLDVKKFVNEDSEAYGVRLNAALKKFYNIHVRLTAFLNMVQEMYQWLTMLPTFTILAMTCLILMVMKLTDEGINWQLAAVMFSSLSELCAYNLFGEIVKTRTSEISAAIFHFDWCSMRLQHQKNYYIIVCYLNKEFDLHTAFGMKLSLITLTTIFKTIYQGCAFMNSMEF